MAKSVRLAPKTRAATTRRAAPAKLYGGFRSLRSHRKSRVWNGFHCRSCDVKRGYKGVNSPGQAFRREVAELLRSLAKSGENGLFHAGFQPLDEREELRGLLPGQVGRGLIEDQEAGATG